MDMHAEASTSSSAPLEPANAAELQKSSKRKRTSVACRRCRRLRKKCVNDGASPCTSCLEHSVLAAGECSLPPRGESRKDRQFRRVRAPSLTGVSGTSPGFVQPNGSFTASNTSNPAGQAFPHQHQASRSFSPTSAYSDSLASEAALAQPMLQPASVDSLPPLEEVVEGVKASFSSFFQVGFLHASSFIERITEDISSVNLLLVVALLAMGAPFSPKLCQRYGGKSQAGEHFCKLALSIVAQEMAPPNLERTQAFLVLGVVHWNKGDGERGWMYIGTAARMAGWLKLHTESTYRLPAAATFEQVIEQEVARRTFWLMHYHECHMLTGSQRPSSFQLSEIDALLPMDEDDFAFGQEPGERAALAGTAAAVVKPAATATLNRSLFVKLSERLLHVIGTRPWRILENNQSLADYSLSQASMCQSCDIWSRISLWACRKRQVDLPWDPSSQFASLRRELRQWIDGLPPRHKWSVQNLKGHKFKTRELGFLSVTLVSQLSEVILHRSYLPFMAAALDPECSAYIPTINNHAAPPGFWETMTNDMYTSADILMQQLDACFALSNNEAATIYILFAIYACGALSSYLCRWPRLCITYAPTARATAERAITYLARSRGAWQLAGKWEDILSETLRSAQWDGQSHLRQTAQRDALLDYRHGMYRHEASGASTKASRPPSRSSAEIAAAAEAQEGLPFQSALADTTPASQFSLEELINGQNSQIQAPLANGYAPPLQPFHFAAESNENMFGPGNNEFDGLFQQLLSQDLTDFSMPLFWQHQM